MTPALGEHAISEMNRVALPRLRFDNEAVLLLAACRNPKSDRLLGNPFHIALCSLRLCAFAVDISTLAYQEALCRP